VTERRLKDYLQLLEEYFKDKVPKLFSVVPGKKKQIAGKEGHIGH